MLRSGIWSSWELRQIETARTLYLPVVTGLPARRPASKSRWTSTYAQKSVGSYATYTPTVHYSIVQDSEVVGVGNINVEPEFVGTGTTLQDFAVERSSPAVDAGNPAAYFHDVSFPPSLGGVRNDMGLNGGPLAGGWTALPATP